MNSLFIEFQKKENQWLPGSKKLEKGSDYKNTSGDIDVTEIFYIKCWWVVLLYKILKNSTNWTQSW